MDKHQLKLFVRGSAVSMVGVGTLGIMNYLIRRSLALSLPETDYGFFYSALALVMMVLVFLDLGLGQATMILTAKSFAENDLPESEKIFSASLWFRMALAVLVLLVMEFAAPGLARHYFNYPRSGLLLLIFLLILTQTVESVPAAVITARKAFLTQQALANLKVFLILAGILRGVKTYGVESAALCYVAGSVIAAVLALGLVKSYGIRLLPLKTALKPGELKNIFALSSWIAVSTAGISVMYYMDTVCITWLDGLKAAAMYNIALPIMQIAQSFFIFPAVFIPFVAEMSGKKDYAGIRKTCRIGSLLMLSTLPVFILGGIYFAPAVVTLLFAGKYAAAAPAVTILWAGMVFFSIAAFNINALNSGGRQKAAALLVIGCVIVNFTLNVILIPLYSYIGAALATAATYMIMSIGAIAILAAAYKNSQ
ncbi:MAG: oligosaccharide flippase family protein [Victivallales bacterium]|nr:oligosaccharide flippase family protein [Victivallales bacterium]